MASKKDDKALETTGTKAIATFDYGDDAVGISDGPGKGYEHQTAHDNAIPFLVVLQQGSPVVAEQKIPNARQGMIMNTVTKQLWENPEGLLFVPATTRHQYTEFKPRDLGGGFRGQHEIDSPIVKKAIANSKAFGEYHTDDGNELVETFYVYGAIANMDGSANGMAIFAFTSSKIKVYKNWISVVRAHTITDPRGNKVRPPLYAHLTRITTEMIKKDNNIWNNPIMSPAVKNSVDLSLLAPDDERFMMAKACKELVDSGAAKVNYDQAQGEGRSEATPF